MPKCQTRCSVTVTLPVSLVLLLGALRPCFTARSFVTFCGLAAGLAAGLAGQPRRRTVVGMLLVTRLAGAFPGRQVHVVGDAAYHGPSVRDLPAAVTWTCRLPKNAVLYDLAPPRPPGTRGRPHVPGAPAGHP